MARSLAADPRIGTELAGYRIEAVLGRGGMSVVYLAEDLALGRKVALKLMAPELAEDRSFRERFRLESRLAASLDHPNVIPIYEAGEADGLLYIAMRYVEGTDLKSLLDREGPLEPARALALLAQVAEAIDAAHARGLVHRDVKPSNVLLAGEGEREHVYLADFGLTKAAADPDRATESRRLSGTADYVAPEQITEGVSGASADIYSLGCVLYQGLTGLVPFPRESEFAVLWAHVDEPPPRPSEVRPGVPHAVDAVIARALAKQPGERYGTGRELVESARLAFPEEHRPLGRRRLLVVLPVVVLLLAALVSALVLTRADQRSGAAPTLALASGALQRIDPRTNELAATIRLGGEPVDVAVGAGSVWALDAQQRTVARIDPETNAVVRTGVGSGTPAAVTAALSTVWVAADGPDGLAITRIDPDSARSGEDFDLSGVAELTGRPLPLPLSAVSDVATTRHPGGALALWVADAAAGSILRGRPALANRFPPRPVDTGGTPIAVASDGEQVWVAQDGGVASVTFSGDVSATPLPFTPSAIAVDGAGVWVADSDGAAVWFIDPTTRSRERIRVAGRVHALAAGAGAVWAAGGDGLVWRIDPATRAVVATVKVGVGPVALAASEDGVWVAVRGGARPPSAALPRRYAFALVLEALGPARPGARCRSGLPVEDCVVSLTGPSVEGFPAARARFALRERRVEGGSLACGGTAYDGPVTSDVRGDAGLGRIDVAGWGTLAVRFDRVLGAFPGVGGDREASCQELHGSWFGVSGRVRGQQGRLTKVIPGELVLE